MLIRIKVESCCVLLKDTVDNTYCKQLTSLRTTQLIYSTSIMLTPKVLRSMPIECGTGLVVENATEVNVINSSNVNGVC